MYPCFHESGGGGDRALLTGAPAGQNIAWGSVPGLRQSWTRRAQGWYDEVRDYNASQVDSWTGDTKAVIGHYTQLVWAQTRQIGCGVLISRVCFNMPRADRFIVLSCRFCRWITTTSITWCATTGRQGTWWGGRCTGGGPSAPPARPTQTASTASVPKLYKLVNSSSLVTRRAAGWP